MTRIDFYILDSADDGSRERYACRVTEKAYQMGHRVFIHSESIQQAQALDEMLWSFRAGSFIPHGLHQQEPDAPVTIGHDIDPLESTDILINLAPEAPPFFSRFQRVAEIVNEAPETKKHARDRFRFYRDRGYELQHHQISQ
ncbi:MAG: DNA polymerase III subunit chi [Gammaproteobacteria bacterium]|nr:DNA polymerase III subunit chi [Gammaproteobacteria bacterium]